MNRKLLAHSARPERGIEAQPLWEHIRNVTRGATERARRAAAFWSGNRESFCAEVEAAGLGHDCGKLAPENQSVLSRSSKDPLPIRHEDAGAAWLIGKRREKAAVLVASHHAGLPSLIAEKAKLLQKQGGAPYRITKAMDHTARHLKEYAAQYAGAELVVRAGSVPSGKWSGLTHRIALSCLVDADHSDTAQHYGDPVPSRPAETRWSERIDALDRYVWKLSTERQDPRSEDRRRVYDECRNGDREARIISSDAAVGSGKTTAVMANLLGTAERKQLRHIFVVLPYTNIIQQSVEVYQKALVLPGEEPAAVVAEVHHRAEFQNPESREMAVLWDAPITVTTAVQFFETLAGNRPATLRKLHELAGSAVFIDEAHASIPVWLWPQTWLWLKELANDWGCQFVLASGSLAKFWEIQELLQAPEEVPDLLTPGLRAQLACVEERRVTLRTHPPQLNCGQLADFVAEKPGPRLVILNTVQSAAVLADFMRKNSHDVLHLSTALTPDDRERVVQRVRARLGNVNDSDWTLVATSCVEAGVDFSFRAAVRERCSVASAIQTGGRVNRHGNWPDAEIWDVQLRDGMFNVHPAFESSRRVLSEMLGEGAVEGDVSAVVTDALRRELVLKDVGEKAEELRRFEKQGQFPEVAELYRVIDSNTRTVVVDPTLIERLKNGERVSWRQLVRGSVQLWAKKVQDLALSSFDHHEELYYWNAAYDPDFLGYMAGVMPLLEGRDTGLYA